MYGLNPAVNGEPGVNTHNKKDLPSAAVAASTTAGSGSVVSHRLQPARHLLLGLGQQIHQVTGNIAVLLVEERSGKTYAQFTPKEQIK